MVYQKIGIWISGRISPLKKKLSTPHHVPHRERDITLNATRVDPYTKYNFVEIQIYIYFFQLNSHDGRDANSTTVPGFYKTKKQNEMVHTFANG